MEECALAEVPCNGPLDGDVLVISAVVALESVAAPGAGDCDCDHALTQKIRNVPSIGLAIENPGGPGQRELEISLRDISICRGLPESVTGVPYDSAPF